MSSGYCVHLIGSLMGMSFTYRRNSSGLSMLPCGVPASSLTLCDVSFPTLTCMFLSCRIDDMMRRSIGGKFMLCSFLRRPLCHMTSNAFSTSISRRAVISSCFLLHWCSFLRCRYVRWPLSLVGRYAARC